MMYQEWESKYNSQLNNSEIQKSITMATEKEVPEYQQYLEDLYSGKVTLKESQKKLLEKIPNRNDWVILNKDEVTTKDLAALSAKVKDEFAYFESDTDIVLFHGGYPTWSITGEMYEKLIKNKYVWKAHSHPHIDDLYPSEADKKTLELLNWQESSTIIDLTGKTREFTIKLTDELNERYKLNNLIDGEKEQYYLDLFGGDSDADGE